LDRRFLIDAEHRGVLRRLNIQTDDVGGFGLELGISRPPIAIEPVWLQPGPVPDRGDQRMGNLQRLRQLARAPVCRAVGGGVSRARQDARFQARREHAGLRPAMPAAQAGDAVGEKALFPRRSRARTPTEAFRQRRVRRAVRQPQDRLGTRGKIRAILSRARHALQCLSVGGAQFNVGRWHAPSYHLQITRTIH
jgi:hypothetical protein